MNPWLAFLPLWLALGGAVLALAADAFERPRVGVGAATLALVAAAGTAGWMAFALDPQPVFGLFAVGRGFSGIPAVIYAVAAAALLGGAGALEDSRNAGQVAALTAFSASAAALLPTSLDLLVTVIALEAVALTAYGLVSSAGSRRSDEAAMKYFLQGAVATGLTVYALSVLFGLYGGQLYLPSLGQALAVSGGRPALTALALLLAAFAFKLGAFPFHSWAPDAYETAAPPTAAFIATAPKLGALAAAVMVFPGLVFGDPQFGESAVALFAALAIASVVFGNLVGLKQISYARMLAYSGIAQVGYALVGFAALHRLSSGGGGTSSGIVVLGAAYTVAAAGAFLGAQAIRAFMPDWDGTVAGLAGLGQGRPALAASLAVCLLSLTGIPLTAGFWGKFLVFGDAVASDMAWLAILGVMGSVVSFGYYGGVIHAMYLEDAPVLLPVGVGAARAEDGRPDVLAEWVVAALALVVLAIGVVPLFTGLEFLGRFLSLLV